MLLNKTYDGNDAPCYSRTTAIVQPSRSRKIARFAHSQSAESLQSASLRQNDVTTLKIGTIQTAGSWQYEPKIVASSLQRSKAIFEQSNCYSPLPISNRGYSSIHETYRRIAELGADNKTYKYTLEWLKLLRTSVVLDKMWWREPLVNLSIDSEIVFEWWHENKKLTVYVLGNNVEYIKVWGTDIDNEMEDGSVTSSPALTDLWKWLIS